MSHKSQEAKNNDLNLLNIKVSYTDSWPYIFVPELMSNIVANILIWPE